MSIASTLPESGKQKLGSVVLSRPRILVATATDRDTTAELVSGPYSFLSDCECPDDCPKDHENE